MNLVRMLAAVSMSAILIPAAVSAQTTVQPDGRGGYTVLDQQGNLSTAKPDGRGGYSIFTNPAPRFGRPGNSDSPGRLPQEPQSPSYGSTINPNSGGAYNEPPAYRERRRSTPTLQFNQSSGFNEGYRAAQNRRKLQLENELLRQQLEERRGPR